MKQEKTGLNDQQGKSHDEPLIRLRRLPALTRISIAFGGIVFAVVAGMLTGLFVYSLTGFLPEDVRENAAWAAAAVSAILILTILLVFIVAPEILIRKFGLQKKVVLEDPGGLKKSHLFWYGMFLCFLAGGAASYLGFNVWLSAAAFFVLSLITRTRNVLYAFFVGYVVTSFALLIREAIPVIQSL